MTIHSFAKSVAQAALGTSDLRGLVRTEKLKISRAWYRRPVLPDEVRQLLTEHGVARGRTIWIQSSWNQFFNVPLQPTEIIEMMFDMVGAEGTLAMPASPISQDPSKVLAIDRAPVATGLLCEVFRRMPGARRSIHLTSSACAIGPAAEFLTKDHHSSPHTWGPSSPFSRLKDVDARILTLGGGFEFLTPLHVVESVLFEEVPFFRSVFDGTTKYRWRRSSGEEGEHEFWTRTGQIQPHRLRRYFDSHLVRETKTSNLKVLSAEAGGFIDRAVELGRQGVTMYVYPKPSTALFPVSES